MVGVPSLRSRCIHCVCVYLGKTRGGISSEGRITMQWAGTERDERKWNDFINRGNDGGELLFKVNLLVYYKTIRYKLSKTKICFLMK